MIVEDIYHVTDIKEKQELISLSPSSKFILYLLKQRGPLTRREILKKSMLPKRTVAYALRALREKNFIDKSKSKSDKRISIYEINI